MREHSRDRGRLEDILKYARIAREEDEEEKKRKEIEQNGRDYQREIEEMNRDFWKECGEAGSNCESWPGWG